VADIQFSPAVNALSSSTHYDPVLGVPIASVDANGKVRKTEYDGFGRVKKVYNTQGEVVSEKEYHLMNEQEMYVFTPNGGEQLTAGQTYAVQWETNPDYDYVFLEYTTDEGLSYNPVDPSNHVKDRSNPDWGNYHWEIPAGITGDNTCFIRISWVSNQNVKDFSDQPFSIVAP